MEISPKALSFLLDIFSLMVDSKFFTLIPSDAEVTTQQAAKVFNVSPLHFETPR